MRASVKTADVSPPGVDFAIPIGNFLPHLDEAVFLVTPEGTVREVSRSACSLLRREAEDIRGQSCEPCFLEQDNLREILREATETATPAYSHLTLLPEKSDSIPTVACAQSVSQAKDAAILLILKPLEAWDREPQLAAQIQNLEDKLVHLQISLGETAGKLAEKTVQLAEERNKTLAVISNMTAGVLALDAEGRITQANRRAEELLGMPEGVLLCRPFQEAAPALAEALNGSGAGKEPSSGSRVALGAKTLQVDSSSILDPEGNCAGRVVVIHDRTEEEELNRMREELVSVVSHEMRGPLTTIKGYLQVILRGEAGPLDLEMNEILGLVNENTHRLAALVEDLLDLSHLESGAVTLDERPVNVTALVYCVYCDLERQAEEKGVCMLAEVPDEPVRVLADERRLLQVLTNLGTNAIKFTPPGGEVTLWAKSENHNVVFGVTDTGIGISEQDQRQLFTKFFRSREAARQKVPGTGLGLCITKRIVEAHRGEIEVNSHPDQGTTFRVILPACSQPTDTAG